MTKIKVVGLLIFILSISLAVLSTYISKENRINTQLLNKINTQKSFTQEISKNIFYIYKNKNTSSTQLDNSIKKFLTNTKRKNRVIKQLNSKKIQAQNKKIALLWNQFYLSVQEFRDISKIVSAYSSIILEKTVNKIYTTNIKLVVEFNQLIELHNQYFQKRLNRYKTIEYLLFVILVLLLIYLFTQLQGVISFIQKFNNTSKHIITNASIKEVQPIEIKDNTTEILEVTNNFNFIVDNINSSIKQASTSIEHSAASLEQLESNIELLLELIATMGDEKVDREVTKKEDALIQSLEELTSSAQNLKNLKINVDALISHHK